jgi:hypothetical protein
MTNFDEYPTSYFSTPTTTLDPNLFEGRALRGWARQGIVSMLNDFLGLKFRHPELWAHPWLAGSGVSYQWNAARQPGDLDCLIGIDFIQFRKANPEFAGLSDAEIAEELNEEFRENLQLQTENWNGYELTFYVNPRATDIRSIKPYAAYDLKYDEWTVTPSPTQQATHNPDWERVVNADSETAKQAANRFNGALQDIQMAQNEPMRRNAENKLTMAAAQANALYNDIHENRSIAFSPAGEGYGDFHNYRWQGAKRTGSINSLRKIRIYMKNSLQGKDLYGVQLPDASTLIRRAATYRNK